MYMWQNTKPCKCAFHVWLLGLLLCYLWDASLSKWYVPSDCYLWGCPFLYTFLSFILRKKHGVTVGHPSLVSQSVGFLGELTALDSVPLCAFLGLQG